MTSKLSAIKSPQTELGKKFLKQGGSVVDNRTKVWNSQVEIKQLREDLEKALERIEKLENK